MLCQYNDDGEMTNPEFVNAPDDSMWWVDGVGACHVVKEKCHILGYPSRVARVLHPDD
jgi:hypothetical protein